MQLSGRYSVQIDPVFEVNGTELDIVTPAATEILGPEVDRLATLHTDARTDHELLAVWLKSHADGSPHTIPSTSAWESAS